MTNGITKAMMQENSSQGPKVTRLFEERKKPAWAATDQAVVKSIPCGDRDVDSLANQRTLTI